MTLLENFELLRAKAYAALAADRGQLGQFYTPATIAARVASMIQKKPALGRISLLDPGAGVGMLSAAAVMRLQALGAREIELTVCEIAPEALPFLREGLELLQAWCVNHRISLRTTLIEGDFIDWAVGQVSSSDLFRPAGSRFDLAILNPPYKKIPTSGHHRQQLRRLGVECTNLYAGFIYASARLLHEHGQLVSINPRSFANGPYFRDFRQKLFALAPLHAVHVFGSRAKAFSSDKVLQENVILSAIKGPAPDQLDIWSSAAGEAASKVRTVPIERAIDPDDSSMILHLEISPEDTEIGQLDSSAAVQSDGLGYSSFHGARRRFPRERGFAQKRDRRFRAPALPAALA